MSSVAGLTHQCYYVEENCRRLRSFPLFQLSRDNHHDSSLRSLYRLYDAICVNEEGYVMVESDCFWRLAHQGCPDPKDPNPTRYAVLAEAMAGAQLEDDSWSSMPGWWCDEQETG